MTYFVLGMLTAWFLLAVVIVAYVTRNGPFIVGPSEPPEE